MQVTFLATVGLLFWQNNRPETVVEQVSYVGNIGTPSSVDEISTMKVAAQVARKTELSVANNVINLSDTITVRDEFVSESSQYQVLPTIVTTEIKTIKDVATHTVQEGETLNDIAAKYDIKTDSIRWANDLVNEFVASGRDLVIPPVDGVYYEVKDGDTLDSIIDTHSGNRTRVVSFNDLESDEVKVGSKIMIPDGEKQEIVTTTLATTNSDLPTTNSYVPTYAANNGYAFGNCTWHAANRRAEVGKPIPNNLGNAATWASLAGASGFGVSGAPQTHDVLYHKDIWVSGGYGHVAFVEGVNPDGSILVSDMNYYGSPGGGFNRVSTRTIPAGEFGNYLFIH